MKKEDYNVYLKHKCYAFEVKGDSMNNGKIDSFEEGDIVLSIEINPDEFKQVINNDLSDFWILDIGDALIMKQITEFKNNKLTCHSLNPSAEYKDFSLNINNISRIYKITGVRHKIVSLGDLD